MGTTRPAVSSLTLTVILCSSFRDVVLLLVHLVKSEWERDSFRDCLAHPTIDGSYS
jgi:hypothetical protein